MCPFFSEMQSILCKDSKKNEINVYFSLFYRIFAANNLIIDYITFIIIQN